jgi:hypothetical protein
MTYDPQQPSGEEPLEQGGQGNQEPLQGRGSQQQQGKQGGRSRQPGGQRGSRQSGEQRGSDQQAGQQRGSYQEEPREGRQGSYRTSEPQHGSHAIGDEPRARRSHTGMFVALGIVGLLALGGLIGGLVAAFGGTTHHAAAHIHKPSVPTHAPAAVKSPSTSKPSSPSSGALVKTFQYIGPRASGGFKATSAMTSQYIYRCPSGPGPFDARVMNASGSDTQTVAKTSGAGGTGSTVLHPKYPGQTYHLSVNTKCEYRVQLYNK